MEFSKKYKYAKIVDSICGSTIKISELDLLKYVLSYLYLNKVESGELSSDPFLVSCSKNKLKDAVYQLLDKNLEIELNKLDDDEINELVHYLLLPENAYISSDKKETFIDSTLNELVYYLLKINNGDSVLNVPSYFGDFIVRSYDCIKRDNFSIRSICGLVEQKSQYNPFSKLLIKILYGDESNVSIKCDDDIKTAKFNKAFIYPELGNISSYAVPNPKNTKYNNHSLLYPDMTFDFKCHTSWRYVDYMLSKLEGDDFRAVALVYSKALMNTKSNEFIQRLLDDGLIEGIIKFGQNNPSNKKSLCPYLVVFSNGNTSIKYMELGTMSREIEGAWENFWNNMDSDVEISYVDYDGIMNLYENLVPFNLPETDSIGIKNVPSTIGIINYDVLKGRSNWIFTKSSFANNNDSIAPYTPIKDLATILKGYNYRILSDVHFTEDGVIHKSVATGDINDGLIDWNNLKDPNLMNYYGSYDKYLIHKGDLLVASKSSKIKTAVVDIEPTEPTAALNGMLIVRTDSTRLNPTYLKMYLDSEEGQRALNEFQSGGRTTSLVSNQFEEIEVPLIDIETQNKKAALYNDKLSSIRAYLDRIDELKEDLSDLEANLTKEDL